MAVSDTRLVQHLRDSDDGYDIRRPPGNVDYSKRFCALNDYMNTKIHPHINTGAAAADPGSWLTDHGPEHIKTVIGRIEDLVYPQDRCVLSPYETYLILVAAHFHDIGIVHGRDKHERMIKEEMFDMDEAYVGDSSLEKRMICDIAMAHGGLVEEENRDTIGRLQYGRWIKRLAAILRFADEISDDRSRTGRLTMKFVQEKAPGSAIFHHYADRLSVPEVRHDTASVRLSFELLGIHIKDRYQKFDHGVYLLDEIMERTLKTHREQVYCARFMSPHIFLERTEVEILICSEKYKDELGVVKYVLEQGYPEHIADIRQLVPQLSSLTGRSAAQHVESIRSLESSPYQPRRDLIPMLSMENAE